MIKSNDGNLWICHTCHNALHKNRIPAQASANGLSVNQVPEELRELNPLESRMIAKRIPFIKLLVLPRGRQKAINGPVVNVPANIEKNFLPRLPCNANIIGIKLKRRLKYKGHYMHQFIRPTKIREAIQYLRKHNKLYSDVTLNKNWENDWAEEDQEMWDSLTQTDNDCEEVNLDSSKRLEDTEPIALNESSAGTASVSTQNNNNGDNDSDTEDQTELDLSSKLRGLPYATLLTPENFNPDSDITSLAPSENEKPRSILLDDDFEALAFPNLFIGDTGTLSTKRGVKLSVRKYFNQRLLNVDGRFAKDIDYLLAAQYATEHKQVLDDISIMLRQRKGGGHGHEVMNAGLLRRGNRLENMIKDDKAYRCLKHVRGSPSYWSAIQHEAMSMIRQLGKPTWFLTLSAADMQWPEVIRSIGFQYNINYTDNDVKEMSWETKCEWLRNNPVTVARNFHHRLDIFFKDFILSKSNPIGEIVDYIIRIEFQARGSPHAHTILYARNAPKIGIQSDEEVIDFINKYQSCKLPDEQDDPDLASLVKRLQTHVHSASCRKTHSNCRFHFPHPPSPETVIAKEVENEKDTNAAKALLGKVHEIISDKEIDKTMTVEMLCERAEVNMNQYLKSLLVSNRGTNIVLKRSVAEININNYNPAILKAWQANMDLSYIVDAYACIMYVISYVLKQERSMSDLLRRVAKEYQDSDLQVQLRKTGAAFLNNREVSAQEAVYRILSIPLKQSSRKVVFINTNPKQNRVVMLKPISAIENLEDEDENVVQKSLIDKYAARPDHLEHLSLAEFGAWYTYSNSQDKDDVEGDRNDALERTKIKLKDGLGTMSKRKRETVIRFPSMKGSQDEKLKLRNKIMLHVPWRSEENDIDAMESYADFANRMGSVIEEKEKLFTNVESDFDDNVQRLEEEGVPNHVWDDIAPQALQNEGDDDIEGIAPERNMVSEDIDANENLLTGTPRPLEARFSFEKNRSVMSQDEYRAAFQILNTKQKQAVLFSKNWCIEAVAALRNGKSPTPYHVFLSGPGGVGKSYVIKLIHNDVTQIFRQSGLLEPSEIPVLVTGPTGTSAFAVGGLTLHSTFLFFYPK